jgi:hypothetical protein
MKGALDGKEVYKNLEVGFKEACLAIIYPLVQLPFTRWTYSSFFMFDNEI